MNHEDIMKAPERRIARVERAVDEIRKGRMVVVTDDARREHEGDLVMAAAHVSADDVNVMAREARGLICCPIDAATAARLALHEQSQGHGPALHGTAFTESLDWIEGTTTGISAADRAATLRGLGGVDSRPEDFASPGHVFPIIARPGGVLERPGHTEAAIDLCRMAGLPPAGVLCEVMNPDGTMARERELDALAERLGIAVVSVEDLVFYRRRSERLVEPLSSAVLPTRWGTFTIHHFASPFGATSEGPFLLGRGVALSEPGSPEVSAPLLVRVHSECATGDLFGSLRCDCGEQLAESMRLIGGEAEGACIYLRQEGRGIGLDAKLKAYGLQDGGLDTVEANVHLGFAADLREYWEAAQILRLIGRTRIRLLTNNPEKVSGLAMWGIEVTERIPLRIPANRYNQKYLQTKRDRLGHAV